MDKGTITAATLWLAAMMIAGLLTHLLEGM